MKSTMIQIHTVSSEISKAYCSKTANVGNVVIATAYALSILQENHNADATSLDAFLKSSNLSKSVSDVLSKILNGWWDIVISFMEQFETDVLKEVVLYENSYFMMNTPISLIQLSDSILDIKNEDSILEIGSGTATFPVYALNHQNFARYTGMEINYNANDIAILRASLLNQQNYQFLVENALTYEYTEKYDKIFSNYPFALRSSFLEECRRELQFYFHLDGAQISRCSSDWLFNATMIRSLKEGGKAVAIMTNGSAYNQPDLYMRQFFAENGYIEAVIHLPAKLFSDCSIPNTIIVFSHHNDSIKIIDAQTIYTKQDKRINMLSEENINTIMHCLKYGGTNTITLKIDEMREHDYNLLASHYLNQPKIENGVKLDSVIRSLTRGSQIKTDLLESYHSATPTAFRYLSLANIVNGSISIHEGQQYLSTLPKPLEKFVIPNQAIVLSKMASPTFRSAVIESDNLQSIVATGNLYIIEIDETKANPYYIQAFFDSEMGEKILDYASSGSAVKTLSVESVKNIMIPLPTMEQQNAIASQYQKALKDYQDLQKKMNDLLHQKRNLLQ